MTTRLIAQTRTQSLRAVAMLLALVHVPYLALAQTAPAAAAAPAAVAQLATPATTGTAISAPTGTPVSAPVQGAGKPSASTKPAAPLVTRTLEASPLWKDLSPAEQVSLKPLAANWATIGEAQKRKWLVLSKNYATLSPPEQQKLHGRMTQWVSLSPKQRTDARLNFAQTKALSPAEKADSWKTYQALSPQEKQKLADEATPKSAGAATVVKPVPTQKMAVVPSTRRSPKPAEVADGKPSVDKNTLLPLTPTSAEPVLQKN